MNAITAYSHTLRLEIAVYFVSSLPFQYIANQYSSLLSLAAIEYIAYEVSASFNIHISQCLTLFHRTIRPGAEYLHLYRDRSWSRTS